jgi:hypothetical protein
MTAISSKAAKGWRLSRCDGQRFSELPGLALVIVFFAVFLAYMETAYLREILKRRRAR